MEIDVLEVNVQDVLNEAVKKYEEAVDILASDHVSSPYDSLIFALVVRMLVRANEAKNASMWRVASDFYDQFIAPLEKKERR